ncbi:hypothetical protein ACVWYI_000985 [Bradyrhizobium sp. LB13.1]
MPTMNTRERPRIAVIVSNNCCSLPIAPSVKNTIWRTMLVSPSLSVSAARIAGTISVPPRACSALTNEVASPTRAASAGTEAGNSTSMVSSKRMTLKRSVGWRRESA